MGTPAVGEDIESTCMKCGGLMWHVVVAKVGDRIAKVQCKRCNNAHRLRATDPINAKAEKAAKSGAVGATKKKVVRKKTVPDLPVVPDPVFDSSVPPRPYRASERFEPGQRVQHPTFGVGLVLRITGDGKMEVRFPEEIRVLAAARTGSTLERPGARVEGGGTPDAPPRKV